MSYLPDDITFIDHARVHFSHTLVPGLFRSLGPRDRRSLKLDVGYGDEGQRIEFRGFEPLGLIDLKILQALAALSGPHGNELIELPINDTSRPAEAFRQLYGPDGGNHREPGDRPHAIIVKATLRKLARLGSFGEDGASLKRIRQSIERMCCVSILFEKNAKRFIAHFMTQYSSETKFGEFRVALNPVLPEVFIDSSRYAWLSLEEVRALKSDPATLMYFNLCGRINYGKILAIELEKLMSISGRIMQKLKRPFGVESRLCSLLCMRSKDWAGMWCGTVLGLENLPPSTDRWHCARTASSGYRIGCVLL